MLRGYLTSLQVNNNNSHTLDCIPFHCVALPSPFSFANNQRDNLRRSPSIQLTVYGAVVIKLLCTSAGRTSSQVGLHYHTAPSSTAVQESPVSSSTEKTPYYLTSGFLEPRPSAPVEYCDHFSPTKNLW